MICLDSISDTCPYSIMSSCYNYNLVKQENPSVVWMYMCECGCICVSVDVYVWVWMYMCEYGCICVSVDVHVYVRVWKSVCIMYVIVSSCVSVCVCVVMYIHVCVSVCVSCVCEYMCTLVWVVLVNILQIFYQPALWFFFLSSWSISNSHLQFTIHVISSTGTQFWSLHREEMDCEKIYLQDMGIRLY